MTVWQWDDPNICNSDLIYRHVPGDGRSRMVDVETAQVVLKQSAFQLSDHPDGWSVFRRGIMVRNGLRIRDIEESGLAPREVWELPVAEARAAGAGVIDREDPDLGELGKAHSLIRTPDEQPAKQALREIRVQLLAAARPAAELE